MDKKVALVTTTGESVHPDELAGYFAFVTDHETMFKGPTKLHRDGSKAALVTQVYTNAPIDYGSLANGLSSYYYGLKAVNATRSSVFVAMSESLLAGDCTSVWHVKALTSNLYSVTVLRQAGVAIEHPRCTVVAKMGAQKTAQTLEAELPQVINKQLPTVDGTDPFAFYLEEDDVVSICSDDTYSTISVSTPKLTSDVYEKPIHPKLLEYLGDSVQWQQIGNSEKDDILGDLLSKTYISDNDVSFMRSKCVGTKELYKYFTTVFAVKFQQDKNLKVTAISPEEIQETKQLVESTFNTNPPEAPWDPIQLCRDDPEGYQHWLNLNRHEVNPVDPYYVNFAETRGPLYDEDGEYDSNSLSSSELYSPITLIHYPRRHKYDKAANEEKVHEHDTWQDTVTFYRDFKPYRSVSKYNWEEWLDWRLRKMAQNIAALKEDIQKREDAMRAKPVVSRGLNLNPRAIAFELSQKSKDFPFSHADVYEV